jgi:hypothetical protein
MESLDDAWNSFDANIVNTAHASPKSPIEFLLDGNDFQRKLKSMSERIEAIEMSNTKLIHLLSLSTMHNTNHISNEFRNGVELVSPIVFDFDFSDKHDDNDNDNDDNHNEQKDIDASFQSFQSFRPIEIFKTEPLANTSKPKHAWSKETMVMSVRRCTACGALQGYGREFGSKRNPQYGLVHEECDITKMKTK